MDYTVYQNGSLAGTWSEGKVEMAMNDKNNISVGRSSDDLVIVDKFDEWTIVDFYKEQKAYVTVEGMVNNNFTVYSKEELDNIINHYKGRADIYVSKDKENWRKIA